MAVDSGIVAQVDYTSRDYTGYRESLLNYASQVMPAWTSRSPSDFGVMMVELFSYLGDIISFYQDRIQDESYLMSATQRSSVVAIAQQLGYEPRNAMPATGQVAFSPSPGLVAPVTLPIGTQVITEHIPALDRVITYETTNEIIIPAYTAPAPLITATVVEGVQRGSRSLTLYPPTPATPGVVVRVEDLGVSTGSKSETFPLAGASVLLDTVRVFTDDATAGTEYARVSDFLLSEPTDAIFTAYTDDRGLTWITFGDGTLGSVPPTGVKVCAAYRTGGGAHGNLPHSRVIELASALPGVVVAGSSPMTGGSDAESLDQIRESAPRVFRAQDRAVSPQDYSDLALSVLGVSDARAVVRSAQAVSIYIAGPNNVLPSEAQRDAVTAYVQQRALAGVIVNVFNATLVSVNIGSSAAPVRIQVLPRYRRESVKLAVEKAISEVFAPPVTTLGSRISLSRVYQAIQDVPGVDWAQVGLLARSDLPQTGTDDILFRENEIPVAGNIVVVSSGGV